MARLAEKYEQVINDWYTIINETLFDGCLHQIRIEVCDEFYFFNSGSLAQYCIPDDGKAYLRFNLQGLINVRKQWIEQYLEENEVPPSIEEVNEEVKEIIAGTIIHEMIHQYGRENSIQETVFVDGIDIHTVLFEELAREKGLMVLEDYNGYSNTHIRTDHSLLSRLEYKDFLEDDYPMEWIVYEWEELHEEV